VVCCSSGQTAFETSLLVWSVHEDKTPNFRKEHFFEKKLAVLLQRSFFAGALNRGIFARQDRPHCGLVLKLSNVVVEQVGSICPCLVQSRYGEFYTKAS
jgi:CRISPR/Cas system-associated endoribonuclease Cas2